MFSKRTRPPSRWLQSLHVRPYFASKVTTGTSQRSHLCSWKCMVRSMFRMAGRTSWRTKAWNVCCSCCVSSCHAKRERNATRSWRSNRRVNVSNMSQWCSKRRQSCSRSASAPWRSASISTKPPKGALHRSKAARRSHRVRTSMKALLLDRGQAKIWKNVASAGEATQTQPTARPGGRCQTFEKDVWQVAQLAVWNRISIQPRCKQKAFAGRAGPRTNCSAQVGQAVTAGETSVLLPRTPSRSTGSPPSSSGQAAKTFVKIASMTAGETSSPELARSSAEASLARNAGEERAWQRARTPRWHACKGCSSSAMEAMARKTGYDRKTPEVTESKSCGTGTVWRRHGQFRELCLKLGRHGQETE